MSGSTNKQLVNLPEDVEKALLLYGTRAQDMLQNQYSIRSVLTEADRQYQREKDFTADQLRARLANRLGDTHKFQDLTVPIVMPQVEAALGYLINVFLTGYPIFGVSSDPADTDAAQQLETIIAENSVTARWGRELIMFFRDGLKYNLCGLEVDWQQRTIYNVETDITSESGAKPKATTWQGNVLKRLDLYNTFFDLRVAPADIAEFGEFAGYTQVFTRMRLKKYLRDIYGSVPSSVVGRALASTPAAGSVASGTAPYTWYIPIINPFPLMQPLNVQTFDWTSWALDQTNRGMTYHNVFIVTRLYARIVPADFGLRVPEQNVPQVWRFIIVNGQVIVMAERLSNAHNYIPIFFGQPIEDGLNYQTKSFATNVTDMQEIASAMWQGFIASKRRLVGDRVLYDPSRITEKAINSTNPAAKIPVRPSAYGKPLSEAVYQFPYRDDQTGSFLQGADLVTRFADLINGQNPAQQGQFQKGNRTKHEYDDVMGHGNTHNQSMAIELENQVFTPVKEVIKLNILQYQPESNIYNQALKQNVKIDQQTLRKTSTQFKVSDGILPEDKIMNTDEYTVALQVLGSSPQLAQGYNMAPLFSYLMKLKGADLTPFEKTPQEIQYEQALMAWQQAAQNAAKAGTPFNTPMPQPPAQQQPGAPGRPGMPAQSQPGAGNPPPVSSASAATASSQATTQGTQ